MRFRWSFVPLCILLLCSCGEREAPLVDLGQGPPDLIVIALDTFRADHIGAYGNDWIQTPNLDRFAAESIVFERCSSTSSWTLPSFSSLFTGRLPHAHGAIGGDHQYLSTDLETLAARLSAAGYHTEAFVAVDYLTENFGTTRGFMKTTKTTTGPVTGRYLRYQPRILSTLRQEREQPFFLFAHYFDAHAPYEPPPPFEGMYYEGDPRDPANRSIEVIYDPQRNRTQTDPRDRYPWLEGITDLEYPVAQYAAGISYLDEGLAELFDTLRSTGRMESSIIVVVGDHGEHLTEHDLYFTHRFPYEECLHVPLMIRLPGGVGAGTRITAEVSLVDVLPTLVSLLQLPPLETTDGLDLSPLIRGEPELDRDFLFAEYGGKTTNMVKVVWNDRYRLMRFSVDGQVYEELFDRRTDPEETENLLGELPEVRRELAQALNRRFPPATPLLASPTDASNQIPDDVKERLKTLGYVE